MPRMMNTQNRIGEQAPPRNTKGTRSLRLQIVSLNQRPPAPVVVGTITLPSALTYQRGRHPDEFLNRRQKSDHAKL